MKNRILCLLLAMLMIVSSMLFTVSCGDDGNDPPDVPPVIPPDPDDPNETVDYPWDTTSLFFQMTDNSNNNDLSSGCRRYLAGVSDDNANVDDMIATRNAKAKLATKTEIVYDYWEESGSVHTWSKDIAEIVELTKTAASTAAPDMYCTYVYDMVGAMLQGCFCNILADLRGTNYFRFLEKDYNPKVDDEGYMYEYMTSVTLSANKMYLIASDYFTDLIRAFFVVPVNMKLLTENATAVTGDQDKDGDSDFDDLVEIVERGEWNYELLMKYCEAVVQENTQTGKVDLGGRVGFALDGYSGLASSGMVYTTNIIIINRVGDDLTDYKYSYPETNPELVTFAENIADLASTRGVYVVPSNKQGLNNIRDAFATNHVLFGGVVCVGSLEDDVYQNMRDQDGFGVVPVPLYRTVNPETDEPDEYLTQIHNVGRAGAIAKNTTKFDVCTAYLNYLSLNSTDILNEYYDWTLSMGAAAGTSSANGNVKMLQYIRSHVRSSFDKVFEDALGIYSSELASSDLWHKVIQSGYNQADAYMLGSGFASIYKKLYEVKARALVTLRKAFEEFQD